MVQWERPAPKEEKSGSGGFDVSGVAARPDGSLALVASDPPEQFLFIGADERGIGTEVHLPRIESWPFRIASDVNGNLWLSGFAHQWMLVPGGTMRDAYLAKYDVNGNFVWEEAYGWWDFRMITDVVPLSSGDLIVAGAHGERSWIAKFDPIGSVLWEHDIGLQKGAVLTATPDGRFAFTALDRTGESGSCTGNTWQHGYSTLKATNPSRPSSGRIGISTVKRVTITLRRHLQGTARMWSQAPVGRIHYTHCQSR